MNTYPDSVRFLYALGNEIKTARLGLDNIRALLGEMGSPERACGFVHVAGTNGKGSTCAMIESALRAAGVRTGLYTSPHLIEPTERIQIAGAAVSEAEFTRAFGEAHRAAERLLDSGVLELHSTYFETVTAMAMFLFREYSVETVVLETGLGGRLDATNVVTPEVCVITAIDYDHEKLLGGTIEAIAAEKAGILKPGVPAIVAKQRPEALGVIEERARALDCPVILASEFEPMDVRADARGSDIQWPGLAVRCPFAGLHQVDNTTTAVLALRALGVNDADIRAGIASARWPGRLERVAERPEIILDGAHNPAGARALASYIREFYAGRKTWLVYGTMRDKSVAEIGDTLFPIVSELILTAPEAPRALDPRTLLSIAPQARVVDDVKAAVELVRSEASPEDAVFISGSLFLVGEARALLVR